ncbi:hypothetical protein [Streptomyces sp. H39-S7]|nr:hypothetical protein [Streptomyces sp. H39-S7]
MRTLRAPHRAMVEHDGQDEHIPLCRIEALGEPGPPRGGQNGGLR